jgi:transposase
MSELDSIPPAAQQVIKDLQAQLARQELVIKDKEREAIRQEFIIKLQTEEIRLLTIRLFGQKGEKLSPDQMQLFFAEASVSAGEVAREADLPETQKTGLAPKDKRARSSNPGRTALPEHLERRELILRVPEDQRHCAICGEPRPFIGYDVREELDCIPARYFVLVTKREKLGAHCLEEQGVATAPAPAQIVPKGKLSNAFIIEVLARKYLQHLPVFRQCACLLEDHGIELSRQTLTESILAAGELLGAVVRAQAAEMLAGNYLQADETRVACQVEEKTGHNHRAWFYQYSVPGGSVVFEFSMGRGRAGPVAFLKGFKGKLQTDAYVIYDKLGGSIVHVGCWAHARRQFIDTLKAAPGCKLAAEVVQRIGKLYAVEREAREAGMDFVRRLALRQAKSTPVMGELKARLVDIRSQLAPGERLARACDYALGQWERLEEYLKDGQIEIDNNWCEGGMRPVALGRKNWLHIGSENAGPKVAAILSIVETCRRLDINLRHYLGDVLPKLGAWPASRVSELTPAAWKAAQNS